MSDKLSDAIAKLTIAIVSAVCSIAMLTWSAYLEWHGNHDHAVWWLLFYAASCLGWLRSIERNTDRIPNAGKP